MSILIPGLKMPPTRGIQIIIDCGHVWVKPFGVKYPEKLSEQAIELPPHGKLIDADELTKEILKLQKYRFSVEDPEIFVSRRAVMQAIKDNATILEAEEEDG